ncbi:hypothetical protein RQP46_003094 [Phenoliferia psychrophenolica]
MASLWRGYISLLQRYTLPTQMATGGVTSGLGDVIYQQGIEKRGWQNHEMYRTRRLIMYGSCCFAPVANRWHAVLNKIQVGGWKTTAAARILTDGVFFAPFATCFFYACQGLMEGRPLYSTAETQGIKDRLGERLWGTVWKQWAFFGPAQIVNMTMIPVYARPPFLNMFAIGWSTFLASANKAGGLAPATLEADILAIEVME